MRNTKIMELINNSKIRFIRKRVTGYEWLVIKKGAAVYVFTEYGFSSIKMCTDCLLHIRGSRKAIKELLKVDRKAQDRQK